METHAEEIETVSSGTNEFNLIQAILLSIENGEEEVFKVLLEQVPLLHLEYPDKLHLILSFMVPCYKYSRHTMARELVYFFDDAPRLSDVSIFYRFFEEVTFPTPLLSFVVESFNQMQDTTDNVTAADVFDVMMGMDDTSNRYYACMRAEEVLMKLDYDSAKYFANMAEESEKLEMTRFMRGVQRREAPLSNIPEYVKNFYDVETQTGVWKILPDPVELSTDSYVDNEKEAIMLLVSGVNDSGIYTGDQDKLVEKTTDIWRKMTNSQRRAQLSVVIGQLNRGYNSDNTNIKVFRLLGPANSIVASNNDTYHEICKHYGCRMLHCDCVEHSDHDGTVYDEEHYDWFIQPWEKFASCYECQDRIPTRTAAIRIPRIHGGWTGRFCSRNCALSYEQIPIEERHLLDIYLGELENIGLQSRE